MAAGLTIEQARLGELRAFLAGSLDLRNAGDGGHELPDRCRLVGDCGLGRTGRERRAGRALRVGQSRNRSSPSPAHTVAYAELAGNGHVRVALRALNGATLRGIAFRAADTALGHALLAGRGRALHIAGALSIDHWQGRRQATLRIVDAAEPVDGNGA